jgi:cytochrome c oxidase subunit 2
MSQFRLGYNLVLLHLVLLTVGGCTGPQSTLVPAGVESTRIARLGIALYSGAAVLIVLIVSLVFAAIWGGPRIRSFLADQRTIMAAGIGLPVVVLSVLLAWGVGLMVSVRSGGGPPAVRIEVVGEQWWWRVIYRDSGGKLLATSANEIHLPQGRPVDLALTTADVIHSFWVPSLAGKLDMIPGRDNVMRINASAVGIYRGQCAEYCGGPHALMAFWAVVLVPKEFEAWLVHQSQDAAVPLTPQHERGRRLFEDYGCGACHTIRGTPARGLIGPDLTHIGDRRTIAAGILPLTSAAIAQWIRDSHRLKPENRMLPYDFLSETEASEIASYLEGLR